MTTLSSDNVFVDSVFEESPPEMSYRSCSRDAITLGSRGSSNGGLEVFIEREEEDIEEEGESHSSVSTRQTVLKVNGYRSSSLSPKKMANGHHSIVELDDTETDGIMNGTDTLQRRESRLKHFKRRLSESFNRRGPSLSPRGEKKPKSRPLSLGISGKNGPLRRNSIATAPATDTIGPTTDDFKPMNAFKSSNNFVNSATLPLRRHSTSCSHSPLGSPFGRLETYKKLDALGEGSYATVYKGISTANGHFVALKEIRLNSEEGTPFTAIREASLLKGLKHSNIVTLHDIIHTPNNLTFVFEYVDTDLSRFMEKHPGPLDPRNVRILLLQLLRGLHFCHRRKILHRDLKPQNILLNHNGELKLADFGLARAKSVPTKTYSHEVVTLWYRPPDVLMGSTEYSTSLDMWGVGCIFVEMLTGKPLFPGLKGVYDQLNRIWGILGTPNEKTWPGIKRLSEYKPEMYEQCDYLGLEVVAPILHPHNKAGNLATKLLQLLPANRISAEDALAHEYFSSLPPALFTLPDSASIFLIPGVLFYR